MVVLDTCAIIEACKKSPGFSPNTVTQIEHGAYILSISFAEIACKVKLGKLELSCSPRELFYNYRQISTIDIISIDVDEWLDSIELSWPDNRDPADRIIISFAAKKHLAIVTSDQKMKQYYKNIIW